MYITFSELKDVYLENYSSGSSIVLRRTKGSSDFNIFRISFFLRVTLEGTLSLRSIKKSLSFLSLIIFIIFFFYYSFIKCNSFQLRIGFEFYELLYLQVAS